MSNARELSKLVVGGEVSAGGVDDYADVNALPSSPSLGDLAFITGTNTLYVYNGSAWFNIAIANQAPTAISGNEASYELAIDGTPTVVTLTSTDPEGFPLTWSSSVSGDTQVGTVTNTDNVFTITPSTNEADAGTLSITFSVTDGSNTENSTSTFTLAFISPLWDETVLSIGTNSTNGLNNSTFVDRSTNASTVTPTGTPIQTAFHPYLDHYSMDFDGNHSITVPTISSGNGEGLFVTGNSFTLETWVNFKSFPVSDNGRTEALLASSVSSGTSAPWTIGVRNEGGFRRFAVHWWIGSTEYINGSTEVQSGTWYHFALSVDSGKVRFFVNGVEETYTHNVSEVDGYPTISTPTQSHSNWHIGQDRGYKTDMYILNWRLVNGYALYNANFTPPETVTNVTGTWMLLENKNRIYDQSSNDHAIQSAFNTPKISAFNPFGQGSEYAVGENKGSMWTSGDGRSVFIDDESAAGTIYPADSDWTVSLWAYPQEPAGNGTLFSWGAGGVYSPINIYMDGSDNTFEIGMSTTGSSWEILQNPIGSYVDYQWYHIELTRSGDNYYFFANGELVDSGAITGSLMTPIQDIGIGSRPSNNSPFKGYISDVQYILGEALHTSPFTPPTSPVTSVNSAAHVPFDNAGIFDKTGNHTLTLFGNASTSTTQTKFANTSMYFDGSGDYIRSDESLSLISSTSSLWTIEGWGYTLTLGGTGGDSDDIIGINRLSDGFNVITYGPRTSRYRGAEVAVTDWNLNEWTHFAITYDGTTYRIFINGTLDYSTTAAPTNALSECSLLIGAEADGADGGTVGNYFTGYLENLQILNGVAKYTSNFTVPDREQGITYQAES